MKKKGGIRLLASVLIFSLMVTGMPGTAVASDQDMDISLTSTIKNAGYTLSGLEQSYRCVREMYRLPAYSGEVITFPAAEVLLVSTTVSTPLSKLAAVAELPKVFTKV